MKNKFTIKQYFKNNRLINQYYCHNKHRKKYNLEKIHPYEYLEYKKWAPKNKVGHIKTCKISPILLWELHKKNNNLIFLKLEERINWKLYTINN